MVPKRKWRLKGQCSRNWAFAIDWNTQRCPWLWCQVLATRFAASRRKFQGLKIIRWQKLKQGLTLGVLEEFSEAEWVTGNIAQEVLFNFFLLINHNSPIIGFLPASSIHQCCWAPRTTHTLIGFSSPCKFLESRKPLNLPLLFYAHAQRNWMQLKLIIKHSLFRGIHTHCLLLRICIHADKTWCRHTWRFSPLFSTSI